MEKCCFVVCPIGKEGSKVRKNSDDLLNYVLKPVCSDCNFKCIRVDEINRSDSITETIIENLCSADLVIADLSTHNPNAFFELGYRTALKKPVIHLKSVSEQLPFDVATIRTLDYNLNDLASVEQLKERLKQTINSFDYATMNASTKFFEEKPENTYSQLLTALFQIQDDIKIIKQNISAKETAAISVLADKLTSSAPKTPETVMTEWLFSLIESPEKAIHLMEISDKLNKLKKEQ